MGKELDLTKGQQGLFDTPANRARAVLSGAFNMMSGRLAGLGLSAPLADRATIVKDCVDLAEEVIQKVEERYQQGDYQ